jgi:hypothetical protein
VALSNSVETREYFEGEEVFLIDFDFVSESGNELLVLVYEEFFLDQFDYDVHMHCSVYHFGSWFLLFRGDNTVFGLDCLGFS